MSWWCHSQLHTEHDLNVCYVNREFHIKIHTLVVKGLTNAWLNMISSNTDLYVTIIILLLFIVVLLHVDYVIVLLFIVTHGYFRPYIKQHCIEKLLFDSLTSLLNSITSKPLLKKTTWFILTEENVTLNYKNVLLLHSLNNSMTHCIFCFIYSLLLCTVIYYGNKTSQYIFYW